jgi:nucleoside-diphosphate-sugar epimerase
MSKIFLLGAQGFIGKHLYRRIVDKHEVVTDMRFFDDRYDVVIYLAGVTHTYNIFDPKLIESNIILADRIFKRPEPIIYASSCSAAFFSNPYALSKQWCEYLGERHRTAIGLRFFNVYGPSNNKGIVKFLMDKNDGDSIAVRGPELERDYIHVDCAVDSIVHLLNPYNWNFQSRIIEVGTGIGTETMDLVNLYMKLSGKSFNISVVEAGDHEPKSMVAKSKGIFIPLAEGLLKTINQSK